MLAFSQFCVLATYSFGGPPSQACKVPFRFGEASMDVGEGIAFLEMTANTWRRVVHVTGRLYLGTGGLLGGGWSSLACPQEPRMRLLDF